MKAIPQLSPEQEERFWSNVKKGRKRECWPWTGRLFKDGYGEFFFGNKRFRAHRVAFRIAYGPVPPDQQVLHKCDTPSCCNPDCLYAGTHTQNMTDKAARTQYRGERHHNAVLTTNAVREIRTMLKNQERISDIAQHFSVSEQTIHRIAKNKTWRHVK